MRRTRLAGWISTAPAVLLLAMFSFLLVRGTAADRRSCIQAPSQGASQSGTWRMYDSHPDHIWNRLHRSLYLRVARDGREYGHDELDPLLWETTKHLLSGPAYRQALTILDEFLDTRAELLISDPLKRALLQRDLWAVFDWTAGKSNGPSQEVRELQLRLAKVMRRLGLPAEQIKALPHTYHAAVAAGTFAAYYDPRRPEAAFLPPDLFQAGGPWVVLGVEGGGTVAPLHVANFSGRSVFQVFIRFPQGRAATVAYLKKLSAFRKPWVRNRRSLADVLPNPRLPQFPFGTRLALVRRMVVIDERGNLTPTNVIESVQLRVHRTIPVEIPESFDTDRNPASASLDVYEFRLSRAKLFAGESGGLRAVAHDEKEFPVFQSHGSDLFELQKSERQPLERHLRPVLGSCSSCHFRPGIHSVLSRMPDIALLRVRDIQRNLIPALDSAYEATGTRAWKQRQQSWRLLREMWQLQPVAHTFPNELEQQE